MKTLLTFLAAASLLSLALPSTGHAQARRPTPTPTPGGGSPWIEVPEATPTPASATHSVPSAASMMAAPGGEAVTYRPQEKSVGLGAGWAIGAGGTGELLLNPNTISARLRLPTGLALEPIAGIVITNDNTKVDSAKTTSSATDIFVGANARKPIWSRSQADLVVIAGARADIGSASSKDAADQKTTSSSFGLSAGYGIGVEFWPRSHWSISMDATNPILAFSSSNSKDAAGVKTTTTHMSISPAFDPAMRVMLHLYY